MRDAQPCLCEESASESKIPICEIDIAAPIDGEVAMSKVIDEEIIEECVRRVRGGELQNISRERVDSGLNEHQVLNWSVEQLDDVVSVAVGVIKVLEACAEASGEVADSSIATIDILYTS
jgi:hypothetical protein